MSFNIPVIFVPVKPLSNQKMIPPEVLCPFVTDLSLLSHLQLVICLLSL